MNQLYAAYAAYAGKRVLVTGHTGFKGSWLSLWLEQLGAEVIGYALEPYTPRDNYVLAGINQKIVDERGDIRDLAKLESIFEQYQPEIVFHLAAQPLVRESYLRPLETYEVNVMGTLNVLECMRNTQSVKAGIMITTDKCYENKEQVWGYRENDPLGGYDPYSSSKAAAELAIQSYRRSFFEQVHASDYGKGIASVRAGNVIGGGDWAKDRLIPDCIRAIEKGEDICIRSPKAIRPWQHVLEPLSGYLLLGAKLLEEPEKYSSSWNFGPNLESVVPVGEVASQVVKIYGKGCVKTEVLTEQPHEANLLSLEISKSFFELGWQPTWTVKEAITYTVEWYQKATAESAYALCKQQIAAFSEAKRRQRS